MLDDVMKNATVKSDQTMCHFIVVQFKTKFITVSNPFNLRMLSKAALSKGC